MDGNCGSTPDFLIIVHMDWWLALRVSFARNSRRALTFERREAVCGKGNIRANQVSRVWRRAINVYYGGLGRLVKFKDCAFPGDNFGNAPINALSKMEGQILFLRFIRILFGRLLNTQDYKGSFLRLV